MSCTSKDIVITPDNLGKEATTPEQGKDGRGIKLEHRDVLYNDDQLGPYPTQLLKYVDKPTNKIVGPVERRNPLELENVLFRSAKGEFRERIQREFRRMIFKYPISASLVEFLFHTASVREERNKGAPHKAPIPEEPRVLSRHFKALGYFLGADVVSIGKLPQSAVYTHDRLGGYPIEAPFKSAIVLVARKAEKTVRASSGWDHIVDPASFHVYQRVTMQAEMMANYIRRLEHEAEPSGAVHYLSLMPQVLLEAGIGEVSRMGIILNPFFGANYKSCCVLTNLELQVEGPIDFGFQEFVRL